MKQVDPTNDSVPWKSILLSLQERFTDVADSRWLLWINRAQGDPFEAISENRKVEVPILHPRFDLRFALYLLELDLTSSDDVELLEISVQLAWEAWGRENLKSRCGQPIAGWVSTAVTPKELARHWATFTHLHVHDRHSKILRFHDPGVREWLWLMLSAAQQKQLLGPASCISAVDRCQNLMHHMPPTTAATRANTRSTATEPRDQKLTLTEDQWNRVEDFAIVHAAWIESHENREINSTAPQPDWHADIFPALLQATQYGLAHPQDRELFATHVLQMGGEFHCHPKMQAIWTRTRDGDPYAFAIDEVLGRVGWGLPQYLACASTLGPS